jgi:hypothetical protein
VTQVVDAPRVEALNACQPKGIGPAFRCEHCAFDYLRYGLQNLTTQIEADLASLRAGSLGNQPGRQATAEQKRRSGRASATARKSAKTVRRRGRLSATNRVVGGGV